MDFLLGVFWQAMNTLLNINSKHLSLLVEPRLLLIVLANKEHESVTELIAALALRGAFDLIAAGEWLPDQSRLRRALRRHTVAVKETLDHPILARPFTCFQLRDQLEGAGSQNRLMLILDFLHHFYNPDLDLSLRQRVLEQCRQHLGRLSRSKRVIVLVQHLSVDEYQQFFPMIASVADEILEAENDTSSQALQDSAFLGRVHGKKYSFHYPISASNHCRLEAFV